MPIRRIRRGVFERQKTPSKAFAPSEERKYGDSDIAWSAGGTEYGVYILATHEFFDPRTSTQQRRNLYGPAVVVVRDTKEGSETTGFQVNDPYVWNWIGRCIREGHLSAASLASPCNERDVPR